jgi:protoheme IX farnesyltransferase
MTTWAMAYVRRQSRLLAHARDFVELTKPRIAVLVLVTVAAGAWLASWGTVNVVVLIHAMIGTALVAASGSAINQWIEQASDARMPRTADRPLPAGRLSGVEALGFALVTVGLGCAYLVMTVSLRTTLVALFTWCLYALIYTPLKARTVSNTAIGAVAGAMPVLIGWSATGARFDLMAGTLFLIVYLWQFPHFMAIAWMYRDDYRAGGLRMLPTVDPTGIRTGVQAVVGSLMLIPVSLVPVLIQYPHLAYVLCALVLGMSYLVASLWFLVRRDRPSARLLLRTSLIYLPVLLGALCLAPLV